MQVNRLSWMIGGPQGSGVDSSANTFAKTCAAGGLYVFGKREYHSNIKGEHSYFQVRVEDREIRSHVDQVHLLATFDKETVELHQHELVPGGGLIYDPSIVKDEDIHRKDIRLFPFPYLQLIKEIAEEYGKQAELSKLMIMKNVLSVAASFGVLDFDFNMLSKGIMDVFRKKPAIGEMNVKAARKAYDYIKNQHLSNGEAFPYSLKPIQATEPRIFLQGAQASAMGKILAGCRFQTYYPITPATDESEFLESHPEFGTVVVQCEDEISAACMAVGGSLAGARSSTSTSGPGFCLMVEAMGWAGINEVPVVIFDYQRGGPSTGLPTRTEQGDLKFALNMGHGDFPRMVVAPGDLEEAFYDCIDAFNYAERYQTPVIVLHEKALANSNKTLKYYDTAALKIDRGGLLLTADDLAKAAGKNGASNGAYKRFQFTENGLSTRPALGVAGGVYWNTGDEHDEYGHITEDPDNRVRMMEKRMEKLALADREIPDAQKVFTYGPKDADISIISWGTTKGAIMDAIDDLSTAGVKSTVNFMQVRLLSPFPEKLVTEFLTKAKKTVLVEMNYTAQLGGVIREKTGIAMDHKVLKWTGRSISRDEVLAALGDIESKELKKVVLTHGV